MNEIEMGVKMAKHKQNPEKQYLSFRNQYAQTENFQQLATIFKDDEMNAILGTFTFTLFENAGMNPKQWTVADIEEAMGAVFYAFSTHMTQASHDELQGAWRDMYIPLNDFVIFLVNTVATTLKHSEITDMLQRVEVAYGVGEQGYGDQNEPVDFDIIKAPEYGDDYTADEVFDKRFFGPGVTTEWHDYIAADIDKYVTAWVSTFFDSQEWQSVSKMTTQENASRYIKEMTRAAYDEYHRTPKNWTIAVIKAVLTDHFVHQFIIQPAQYQEIGPVLEAFFSFAKRAGYLRSVNADRTIKAIKEVEETMVVAGQNRQKYSETKKMWLDAASAGIDKRDRKETEAFIGAWVENQQARRAGESRSYERDLVYFNDGDYLTMPHDQSTGQLHWTKAVATRTHGDLSRYAWYLWSLPENQDLHEQINEADFVDFITFFGDAMYAQFLETPKRWQPDDVRIIWSGYDPTSDPESFALLRESLKRLVTYLDTEGKLAKQLGPEIKAVFDGAQLKPKKKSNVVSLADAKKRLDKK
ncbi:hypothetical protein [Secundilactobacillus collinoides]|uniref:Uncharacterized protein n=3 Tax=Secundilactobacillus collinoides TaxID=33960 RepID=A0A0R2BFZ6_SECCO|nr:hypothetical protein [Secundilactobacillus collinoides]KRM78026.1 hypothetical protein FC82_GL000052 [Secundilactobacillus collinoides DSM 20515 = JCM 1123]KZL40044.1 hypothetical protein TY91_09035 [Secundilactobacillus collinoides]